MISGRSVVDEETERLSKTFNFANFADALAFTVKVGKLIDENGHHPIIITEWGGMPRQNGMPNKIGGLHINDFIMAAKTDALMFLPCKTKLAK